VFNALNALLVFVPQMVNTLGRSRRGRGVCFAFTLGMCALLTMPLLVLGWTAWGNRLVGILFSVRPESLGQVVRYLRWFSPLILLNGTNSYILGLLVQDKHTGKTTVLRIYHTAAIVAVLLVGFRMGLDPVLTLSLSMLLPTASYLLLVVVLFLVWYRPAEEDGNDRLSHGHVLAYFWPVATASWVFALTRPVMFAFLNRTAGGESAVAAVKVAFDFGMVFHQPLNQFRHLFVTFGLERMAAARRFLLRMMIYWDAAMILVVATPLSTLILRELMNVRGDVLRWSREALAVLCLTPLIISFRNYWHGLLLASHRTAGMAGGAVGRIGTIALASWALWSVGWLNHASAAAVLLGGFAAEGLVSAAYARHRRVKPGDA
jgi:hypothetical protein